MEDEDEEGRDMFWASNADCLLCRHSTTLPSPVIYVYIY